MLSYLPDLVKVSLDGSDDVVLAVRVPVVDVDLEGTIVVAVADVPHLNLERLPVGAQVVLDHFALVHDRKLENTLYEFCKSLLNNSKQQDFFVMSNLN